MVGLHVGVQGVEGGLQPAVDALPLAAHLGHPAPDQQVAILIPLTHHHTTPASWWARHCLSFRTQMKEINADGLQFIQISVIGGHVHIV